MFTRCAVLAPAWLALAAACAGAQEKKAPASAPGDAELVRWVDAAVRERMPTAEDRRFDEVGWVRDIRQALSLAREHDRPVFLFTHDGRMNLGRC